MTTLALAIAVKGEWDAYRLLNALRSAGANSATEIHVACDPQHTPATVPDGLTVHSKANESLFGLWGLAVAETHSDWVAILHADALPAPGWFTAMSEAIARETSSDGFMGAVEPAFGPADPRMIGYLTEYVQFHRPRDPRQSEVPGNNLVLPRSRLISSSDFSKTRLLEEGLSPQWVDDAVVLYSRPLRRRDYRVRRFRHGRAYAAARTPRLSLWVAIPLTAALPLIRTTRIMRHAWRHKSLHLAVLRWLPAIWLAESCWSAGELAGYLTGRPGDAAALD